MFPMGPAFRQTDPLWGKWHFGMIQSAAIPESTRSRGGVKISTGPRHHRRQKLGTRRLPASSSSFLLLRGRREAHHPGPDVCDHHLPCAFLRPMPIFRPFYLPPQALDAFAAFEISSDRRPSVSSRSKHLRAFRLDVVVSSLINPVHDLRRVFLQKKKPSGPGRQVLHRISPCRLMGKQGQPRHG